MEKEYQISWGKIIGVTALIIIIIAIIYLIYPRKDNTMLTQQTYISNITLMKNAGFEYFRGNNLPKDIGDSKRLSLDEMLVRNLIIEFYDEEGNTCNRSNSYIEATKTMENEYEMSVYLSCDNKSDYIVTSISDVVCTDCNVIDKNTDTTSNNTVNNDTDTTSNSSSTNTGTLKPTYTTNNNYNNNTSSNSSDKPVQVTQTTNININYVNTCCTNGANSNCDNNCLANVYHSVVFDANGGSSVRTQIVKHGQTASYKTTYRAGYEFLGWYLNGEEYDFSTPVTNKITLYAKWRKKDIEDEPKKEYIVDFDSNGGSYVAPEEVLEGDAVTRPSDPIRKCYTFAGWYVDEELTERYNFNSIVTSDMTLYAKWIDDGTCKETYIVDFDSNGGSYVASEEVLEGDVVDRPKNPTKECYDFGGWYTDQALTKRYSFSTPVTSDMTLYAKWIDNGTCKEKYTVDFDSNGGSSVRSQSVLEGARATEPNDPTRSGYRFLGWYLDGSKFSFNTRIYEDITLVAKWEKEEEKYNTYCKVENDTYYSISYTSEYATSPYMNWSIKFGDLRNVDDLKITKVGYLTSTSMYNSAYNKYYNQNTSMVGGNSKYEVNATSGSMLKTYSLKAANFTKSLSAPYYRSGYWYVDASVYIKNKNDVTPYASSIGKVYFIPFYFDVKYTDLNNCVDDKASNSYKYSNYKIVDSYWK